MFKMKQVRGTEVPIAARELTRGESGLMMHWYDNEKEHMIATLLYHNKTLIGWCCAIRVRFLGHYTKTVEISTFVHKKYRGKGLAKKLLAKTVWMLRMIDPKTIVRYGAPQDDADYFNKTYDATIIKGSLRPKRYFCA